MKPLSTLSFLCLAIAGFCATLEQLVHSRGIMLLCVIALCAAVASWLIESKGTR